MCRGPPHFPGEGSTPPWPDATSGAEHPPRTDASTEAQPDLRKESNTMKRICAMAALAVSALLLMASAASAQVAPGTYTPDAGSFDSANAPGSSHLRSGTVQCVVTVDLDVNCDAYVLGGVGNTNAVVSLTASYTAIIDCNNPGNNRNNPIESHTADFEAADSETVPSTRNGQLRVPAQSVSAFDAPQVCPNDRWVPEIRDGTLELVSFTYTLTFAGFDSYITISEP
jgi:hypothetical protein